MIKIIGIVFAIILSSLCTFADGGASTGGGGAFVCRDQAGKIQDSELLDLWEAREIEGWNIPYNSEDVDLQISKALLKLKSIDESFYQKLLPTISTIQKNAQQLPGGVSIQPPSDALNKYGKTGCSFEGMMLYDGDYDRLMINSQVFSHLLNNTNIAAAWVHESIYKVFRDAMGHADSRNARKLTACLFATDDCHGLAVSQKVSPGFIKCSSSNNEFYFDPKQVGDQRYLFSRIGSTNFTDLAWIRPSSDPYHTWSPFDGILANFGYTRYWGLSYAMVNLNFPADPSKNESVLLPRPYPKKDSSSGSSPISIWENFTCSQP